MLAGTTGVQCLCWAHDLQSTLESPVANLVGLQHLPRHMEAANELVKQFQLPDKLPLHPFGFVGTDPLKLSEGERSHAAAQEQQSGSSYTHVCAQQAVSYGRCGVHAVCT